MKKAIFKFDWLTKAALFLTLLLFCNGQAFAGRSIVSSSQKIAKDNVNKVKDSALDLLDEFKTIRDELANAPSDIMNEGKNAASQSLDQLNNTIKSIQNLNVDDLKKMDLNSLKGMISDLKNNVTGNSETATRLRNHFNTLEDKTARLINNVKNVVNFAYTMPVGMTSNRMKFEISLDELAYSRDYKADTGAVAFNAHAYWTLPFSVCEQPVTVSFRGEHVVLMGKGESKIYLEQDKRYVNKRYTTFPISKGKIYLDLEDKSYVDFDCNGFKEMYLKGRVRFTSKVIYNAEVTGPKKDANPANPEAKTDNNDGKNVDGKSADEKKSDEKSADSKSSDGKSADGNDADAAPVDADAEDVDNDSSLVANFELQVSDLNDILIVAGLESPFKIKATQDVIYQAQQVVIDFSTSRNADNFQFPKGYKSPFGPGDDAYWTGFAIKTLSVDLRQQFPEFPVKADAYNMLIDETGVSGWFEATIDKKDQKSQNNSTIEAKFTGVSLGLSGSRVSGGGLAGEVTIKPLKDKNKNPLVLGIDGKMYTDANDHLCVDLKTEVKKDMQYDIPLVETTTLTLGQGTYFQYEHVGVTNEETNVTDYKNIYTLVMNGGLDIVGNKLITLDGLLFEGLRISSGSPHFDAGKFSLNGVDVPALHGLPFSIKSLSGKSRGDKAILAADVNLTLIGKESPNDEKQGASVDAKFNLIANVGANDWKLSGLEVEKIDVNIDYSSFHLNGKISSFKDNEIYGDGFMGSVNLSMNIPKIDAGLTAYFGKTSYNDPNKKTYKYWYVSGYSSMPPGIVLFPPAVYLKSVSLALYSKSKPTFDVSQFKVTEVKPDPSTKFGFRAGIGFYGAQDNLIDANAEMGMEFSSSGGVSNMFLNGRVGILGKGEGGNFSESFMVGTIECKYDFENNIFDLDVDAKTGGKIKNIIKEGASMQLHTEPSKWYCHIGTASSPVKLTFMEKINGSTYLMFGHDIPTTLPPLDPKISAMFNVTQSTATSTDHSDMFKAGTGFAFGVALAFDVHLNSFIYADLDFLGGIDVLVVRGDFCPEASSKYRAKGQVYVYLDAAAGIKFRKKKFEIVEFSAAADLMGEVPKPVFVEGNIAFKYRILGGLVRGHAHAKYTHGSPCDPGRKDNGVIYDGSEFNDLIEEEKATDSQGRAIDVNSED